MKTYLQKAIDIVGSQNKLANALGTSQSTVWSWLNETKQGVPSEYCIPIEKLTEGKIRREQLRPDIYPAERCRDA